MSEVALYRNQPVWIGSVDIKTGKIEETHTYEEAKRWDCHAHLYFSEQSVQKNQEGKSVYFWVESDGTVQVDDDAVNLQKQIELSARIREQLFFLVQKKGRPVSGEAAQCASDTQPTGKKIYVLYSCDDKKQRSSMKILGMTSNLDVLYAMIGNQIMCGEMLYHSREADRSWELFQQDYRKEQVHLGDVEHCIVEQYPDLSFEEPQLFEDFPKAAYIEKRIEYIRKYEMDRGLNPDGFGIVFSEVYLNSPQWNERLFLPGYGSEDTLKQAPEYERFVSGDTDCGLHVEVNTYVLGSTLAKEADWAQVEFIKRNLAGLAEVYPVSLICTTSYDICNELDMEQ